MSPAFLKRKLIAIPKSEIYNAGKFNLFLQFPCLKPLKLS